MVEINENGKYKYVDVREYPVGNKESFSKNLELFETTNDNPYEKAVKRVNNESAGMPEGFDPIEGVECIIDCNFSNNHADYIVNNTYVARVIANKRTSQIGELTEEYKENANNTLRYSSYVKAILKVFNSRYMSTPPDLGINRWLRYCENDLIHSGEQVGSNIKHHRERARRVAEDDINVDGPTIELLGLDGESHLGEMGPEMGMREIAGEYASISESIKPLLKDLLVSIDPEINRNELTSLGKIREKLSGTDCSFLRLAIEPQIRHGHAHSSMKIDVDENNVVIYDRNDSDPSIEKKKK